METIQPWKSERQILEKQNDIMKQSVSLSLDNKAFVGLRSCDNGNKHDTVE